MSTYRLPEHVFACRTEEAVVFLDLKRNKYLGVRANAVEAVSRLLEGSGSSQGLTDSAVQSTNHGISALVHNGLLLDSQLAGKEIGAIGISRSSAGLLPEDILDVVPVAPSHVLWFAVAIASAFLQLKVLSLERVVSLAQRHRSRARQQEFDVARARTLVTVFRRLRPFVFTARDACLLDSLALLNFLNFAGLHSQWVFGVKTAPFAAHCWLQHGTIVLNDTLERVAPFAPIMAV